MKPMFSIIVVALNPGEKLIKTVESIADQTFTDYQVVVKDGGSKDDSLERLREMLKKTPDMEERVLIVEKKDGSIYEGMNQAAGYASGEYLYFLNCGDLFAHDNALQEMAQGICEHRASGGESLIFYGDIYDELRGQVVSSNPRINDFACYRNVPCHQACVYHRVLFSERGYRPEYKVRGDYEHFLWSYFEKQAKPLYVKVTMAKYEGGGFSETEKNRIRSAEEHKEITSMYMSKRQVFLYRTILFLTLAPLRTKMAESPAMSGVYNFVKKLIYR